MEITQEQLKELLHYDPETGVFRWRKSVSRSIKPWDVAGTTNDEGYVALQIKGKGYKAHRLAWLYMTRNWPIDQIDHFDGIRQNNSWINLRPATCKQNNENKKLFITNKSGYRGVLLRKDTGKWSASVKHNQKRIFLGCFKTAEEAAQVAAAKRAELFTHDHGRDQVNTGV